MAEKQNVALRNAMADNLSSQFNGGTLKIYTGSQPTNGGDSPTGTLLGTITLPNPCCSAASSGSAAKTGTWQTTAVASGVVGWARFESSAGAKIHDVACGASGGGEELLFDITTVVSGGLITVSSYSFTIPAS